MDELFRCPENIGCVQEVNRLAEANWAAFIDTRVNSLPHGQLMKYPYIVDKEGRITVKGVDNFGTIPDGPSAAKVIGAKGDETMELLTT
jgi:phospholipase D1/2